MTFIPPRSWWAVRLGARDNRDDIGASNVALTTAYECELGIKVIPLMLHGEVHDVFEDGTSRIARIKNNAVSLPGDDAITILLAVHRKVEGCDWGELAADPVVLDYFLCSLFGKEKGLELARMLNEAAFGRSGASDENK